MDNSTILRLVPGIRRVDQHTGAFELTITDFIDDLIPPSVLAIEPLHAIAYYVTSGDATHKTAHLHRDVYAYACRVRTLVKLIPGPAGEAHAFLSRCWSMAGKIYSLLKLFEKARGPAVFLELERIGDGRLSCVRKNPRPKGGI